MEPIKVVESLYNRGDDKGVLILMQGVSTGDRVEIRTRWKFVGNK